MRSKILLKPVSRRAIIVILPVLVFVLGEFVFTYLHHPDIWSMIVCTPCIPKFRYSTIYTLAATFFLALLVGVFVIWRSILNRLLSVVRSRTDKSVELSRALLTSRLSMGNGCAEARLWRGREVLHACRNAGARIDAGSGQGSTWLRKAAMTGSATASLSRATGASVGRTSGRYGIGIVGSGRIVTAALALRSGTRSRAAFREGAFAATGPVHTVRRR